MAPNLAIRSDSWLNLSGELWDKAQRDRRASTCEPTSKRINRQLEKSFSIEATRSAVYDSVASEKNLSRTARSQSYSQEKRHSTGFPSNHHHHQQLRRVGSYTSEQASYGMGSAQQQQQQQQQQHLLIRLRQQSYKQNRSTSSNNSSISNLSNSIDLNPTLLFLSPPNEAEPKDLMRPIGRESSRLRFFKDKLRRRANGIVGSRVDEKRERFVDLSSEPILAKNQTIIQKKPESPIVRSLSSFSERLSGKLGHFRHSWKHFLHAYQQKGGDQSVPKEDRMQSRHSIDLAIDNSSSRAHLNKLQLTDEWIMRHHHWGRRREENSSRPKSEEIWHHQARINIKINDQPDNQQNNQFLNKNHHLDSSSSITLVSEQAIEDKQQQQQQQLLSCSSVNSSLDCSSSTLNSEEEPEKTPGKRQPAPQRRGPKDELKRERVKRNNQQQQQQQDKLQLPTSDYWSTVTSDYNYSLSKRPQVNSKQSPQMATAAAHGDEEEKFQNEPMLLNGSSGDQEYYFDVANAPAIERHLQQVVPPPIGFQATQQHDPLNQPHQVAPILADLTHTNLAAAFALNHEQQAAFISSQPAALNQFPVGEEDYDDYAVPSDETCRLDRSQVELVQMIGEGQKGFVFLGKLQSRDGQHIQDVAIKTLKYETNQLIEKLMREAAMMRQFEHPHIIKFIGVCPETPALIAMELAEFGEVKQYLKLNKHLTTNSQLVLFTFQISTALSYLESKQFVHRDVAARNVLVCSHNCVKLADFGLSRNLTLHNQQESATKNATGALLPATGMFNDTTSGGGLDYVALSRGKLPVRWLAPESLAFRRFTSASDVWMFAVCSWELFHFGQLRPWSQIRNNQVLLAIESGQRLARPPNCPARLYQLMLQCWSYAPIQRPKFKELKQILWSIYLNERAREQLELEQQQQEQLIVRQQQQQQQQQQRQADKMNFLLMSQQHRQQQQLLLQSPSQMMRLSALQPPPEGATVKARFSASPLGGSTDATPSAHNIANSAGNMSGYSSATATTAETLSNQSSPSSSLDSLARRKQQQLLLRRQLIKVEQARIAEATAAAELEKSNQQQRIQQCQMRRFQKNKGHVLQKQRSQGSITSREQQQFQHTHNAQSQLQLNPNSVGHAPRHLAYDDHALLYHQFNSRLQQQQQQPTKHYYVPQNNVSPQLKQSPQPTTRPLSEFRIIREDEDINDDADADIDEEDDDSSSGTEPTPLRKLPINQWNKRPTSSRSRNALSVSPVNGGRSEPTYEGIVQSGIQLKEEISMLNPSPVGRRSIGCSPEATPTRPVQPSPKLKQRLSKEERAEQERDRERLAEVLKSLKMSPMKAKLSYSRQNSLQKSSPTSPDGGGGDAAAGTKKADKAAEEAESRQLALHKRLLGHIRLPSNNRGQQKSDPQATGSSATNPTKVETVDQSLQILESLIGENHQARGNHQMAPLEGPAQANKLNSHSSKLSKLAQDLSNKRLLLELQHYHLNKQRQNKQKRAGSIVHHR